MQSTIETVCHKAPAGGAVSIINGQFYDGGEFMPVHGKSNAKPVKQCFSRETGKPIFGEGKKRFGVFTASGSLSFHVWADDTAAAKRVAAENGAGEFDEVLKG